MVELGGNQGGFVGRTSKRMKLHCRRCEIPVNRVTVNVDADVVRCSSCGREEDAEVASEKALAHFGQDVASESLDGIFSEEASRRERINYLGSSQSERAVPDFVLS